MDTLLDFPFNPAVVLHLETGALVYEAADVGYVDIDEPTVTWATDYLTPQAAENLIGRLRPLAEMMQADYDQEELGREGRAVAEEAGQLCQGPWDERDLVLHLRLNEVEGAAVLVEQADLDYDLEALAGRIRDLAARQHPERRTAMAHLERDLAWGLRPQAFALRQEALHHVPMKAWFQQGTQDLVEWEACRHLLNHTALAGPGFFRDLYEEVEEKGYFNPEEAVEDYEWDLYRAQGLAKDHGHPQIDPITPIIQGQMLVHETCTRNTVLMLRLGASVALYRANGAPLDPDSGRDVALAILTGTQIEPSAEGACAGRHALEAVLPPEVVDYLLDARGLAGPVESRRVALRWTDSDSGAQVDPMYWDGNEATVRPAGTQILGQEDLPADLGPDQLEDLVERTKVEVALAMRANARIAQMSADPHDTP